MRHVEWITSSRLGQPTPGLLQRGNVYHGTLLINRGTERDCFNAAMDRDAELAQLIARAGFTDILVFVGEMQGAPRTRKSEEPTVAWSADEPLGIDPSQCIVRFEAVWDGADMTVPKQGLMTTEDVGLVGLWDASYNYQKVFDGGSIGWKLYKLERGWTMIGEELITEDQARLKVLTSTDGFYGYGPMTSTQPSFIYDRTDDTWRRFQDLPTWIGFALAGGEGWRVYGEPTIASEGIVRQITKDVAHLLLRGNIYALGYGPANANRPTVAYSGRFFQNPQPSPTILREAGLPSGVPNQYADLPFPTPSMQDVDTAIATQAMDAIRKAALACPQLALPGGALQNAGIAFGVFASSAAANNQDQQKSLDTLFATLDRICPNWRGKDLGTMPSSPPDLPAGSESVATILAQLASAVASGAYNELPPLAEQSRMLNLPALAIAIEDYLGTETIEGGPPPPPPPPDEPPPDEPPPPPEDEEPTKKKGISGGLVAAGVVALAVAAIVFS